MDKEYFKILIEKYLDGNASTAEVKELCEWIKNNDSLDRWIMQAIERSDSHLDEEVYERLYTRIKEDIESREKKSHRRFSFVPMLRWAAVVVYRLSLRWPYMSWDSIQRWILSRW